MTEPSPINAARLSRRTFGFAALAAVPVALAGCGSSSSSNGGTSSGGGSDAGGAHAHHKPVVFASTSVWGSIATAIGGDHVEVISAISSPDQDPHDFEPSAREKADAERAAIIIVNGGGYDDWALTLAKSSKAHLINAVDVSGLKKDGEEEFNEHVFYDVDTAMKVADAVEKELSKAAPDHADHFSSGNKTLQGKLKEVADVSAKFAKDHPGLTAVATEPVVSYLLEDMGVKDITPEEYVEQSETAAGPSAAAVHETRELLVQKKANLLILNAQTEDETALTLQKAATEQGIPVAKVYETMPSGVNTYVEFIGHAQRAIADSLA